MPEPADLYEILQVHPSAHPEVIQAAYRRLAQIYHPDRNPAADAGERMAAINRAYEVLGDPQQRAAYDRQRAGGESNGAGGGAPVPDVIRAKSFQLVNDAGQTRAELSLDGDGNSRLVMNDQDGECWFEMSHDWQGSRIIFWDRIWDVRLTLGLNGVDGESAPYLIMFYRDAQLGLAIDDVHVRPSLAFHNHSSAVRLDIDDVHPQLEFRSRSGVVRLAFVERDDGTPTLEIVEERRTG